MGKLKFILVFLLAFLLCGCSSVAPTTALPPKTGDPNITFPPDIPSPPKILPREDWNIEARLAREIEYVEDDGKYGRGFIICYEIRDLDNIGFYYESLGGGLEYFNGTEWEVVYPYKHRPNIAMVIPNKEIDRTLFQEAIVIRRWDDRLPDGKYRYVKLLLDGSTPQKEKYVTIEFEIKKPA